MAIKPVWGPTPEAVENDKLNQMVDYSEALAGVGVLFRAADPQPAGLLFAYLTGRVRKADGAVIEVAAGSVALTGSATNYIEVDNTGTVAARTGSFTDSKRSLWQVATDSGSVTSVADKRVNFDFGAGNGGDSNLAWEGEWATATEYAEGDIVQSGAPASSYRATANHTSGATTEPGVGATWQTRWEIVAGAGGQGEQGEQGLPGGSLNWRNDWANATAYSVDDAVQDGTRKSSYRCHTAHTSGATTRPGLGASWASYWTLLAQAGQDGAPGPAGAAGTPGANGLNGMVWTGAWSSITAYAENDGVSRDGSTYICIAANTNQEPPNALYWDLVSPKGDTGEAGPPGGSMDWHEEWEDGAGYVENDAIPHGAPKSSYRCKADHTAGVDNEPGVGVDWQDYWILFAEAGSADANTLQGEAGAHYLDRANHTGSQAISTVTGLQTALDGKALASHTHAISDVTGLSTTLDDLEDASVPTGGTNGQVLTKVSGVPAWADPTGGGGGGHVIQDGDTPMPQRAALSIQGAGVGSMVDDEVNDRTILNIPGGIGSGVAAQISVRLEDDQSIPNSTWTNVIFDFIEFNEGDGFTWDEGEPSKVIATEAFDAMVVATVEYAANATGMRAMNVAVNGTGMASSRVNATSVDETNIMYSLVVPLSPGDEVTMALRQLSGGALNIRDITRLHLVRLAPQGSVGGGGAVNILDVWLLS